MRAILLSGGMDSIALAYWQRPERAITIDYGQQAASAEIGAASQVAGELGMPHHVIRVDCSSLGSGDMAGRQAVDGAPVPEWWPFRNQLLLTLSGMLSVSLGVREIMIGSVASDGTHADGRPEFFDAVDRAMRIQESGIRVVAPAIAMSTGELVRTSGIPRDVLSWSHSCHVGNLACGACRGCVKHYEVMDEIYGTPY